jgi:hypothetical protein
MFFFASSRCSAGDPVSPAPEAEERPLDRSDGLNAILGSLAKCVLRNGMSTRSATKMQGKRVERMGCQLHREGSTEEGSEQRAVVKSVETNPVPGFVVL